MKEIIYVPIMHSSLAPAGLPEDVLFVCPGLCSKGDPPANVFEPESLPFKGHAAKTVLDEMLSLGLFFSPGGDLKLKAGQGWLEREKTHKHSLRAESMALKEFSRSGAVPKGNQWSRAAIAGELLELSQTEQFCNAQKALLLAWKHEENILSMHDLEKKVLAGQNRLKDALGDSLSAEDFSELASGSDCHAGNAATLPPARPEYSWRIVLDALSAFLPDGARLLTAYTPMIEDSRELGLLEPLPGNVARELEGWPEELVSTLLSARLPMWRLLGYAAQPQDRPWLGTSYELLAAPRLEL